MKIGRLAVALLAVLAFSCAQPASAPSSPTVFNVAPYPSATDGNNPGAPQVATGAPTAAPSVVAPPPASCPEGMVMIPASTFTMGAPAGEGDATAHPQLTVTLHAYCIDRTEVTVQAYARCVVAGACEAATGLLTMSNTFDAHWIVTQSTTCNASLRGVDMHPVNCVSQAMGASYCRWAGGARLPTEAEWELGARGTDGRRYPWGAAAPTAKLLNALGTDSSAADTGNGQYAMYRAPDGFPTTAPVGSFLDGASPWGLMDMAGNVDEWVADGDWAYADHAPSLTNPSFPVKPAVTPLAGARGGSWAHDSPASVTTYGRLEDNAAMRDRQTGFRCAR